MKYLTLLSFFAAINFFTSCNSSSNSEKTTTGDIFVLKSFDAPSQLPLAEEAKVYKDICFKALPEWCSELKEEQIESFKKIGKYNIHNFGECEVWEGHNVEYISMPVCYRDFLSFFNHKTGKFLMLFLCDFQPVKLHESDNSVYIGGSDISIELGYFKVFDIINNRPEKIFDGSTPENQGLLIFKNSYDSIRYPDKKLQFINKDVNGDKLLDLVFEGYIGFYKKRYLFVDNLLRAKPIHSKPIALHYYASMVGDRPKWTISDPNLWKTYLKR